jgi:hypothetical protein
MRVLYLYQYFAVPKSVGGTRSYEMARRLVKAGHKVTMVTSSAFLPDEWSGKPGWNRHIIEGIDLLVYALPYSNRLSFHKRIWCFFKFSFAALRKVRSISSDVVLATSTPLTIAIPGVYSARRHKIPMVFEVRDLWPA